jgi:transcriptional regulator with AAA-type ATPase domain
MVASTYARRAGINAILITSSTESVEEAFLRAENLSRTLSATKRRENLLESLLRHSSAQAFALSKDGAIEWPLPDGTAESRRLAATVERMAEAARGHDSYRAEQKTGGKITSVEFVREGERLFAYARQVQPHAYYGSDCIKIIDRESANEEGFNLYCGVSSRAEKLRARIAAYSKTAKLIYIEGEPGTRTDWVAAHFFENSPHCGRCMYQIDCETLGEKQWNWLTQNPDSPFCDRDCTLYFKNVEFLSVAQSAGLTQIMEQSGLLKRNCLMFSSEGLARAAEGLAVAKLLAKPDCFSISLPSLRERAEDIQGLAMLYINLFNSEFGKQIIGFDPLALDEITRYEWPRNLEQFKRVLRELVMLTNSFYIPPDTALDCIAKERAFFVAKREAGGETIDKTKTLDKIVHGIVEKVLHEENGNQKRVAERLGISRTTIWRILKGRS